DTAIRTLGTFESGLLYTHQADTAAAQIVAATLLKTVELIQRQADPARVPKAGEIISLLKIFRIIVNFHLRRGSDGRDYLRFVSQFFPYPEQEKKSLIIAP